MRRGPTGWVVAMAAAGLLVPGVAVGQPLAKASFVNGGSFTLPDAGEGALQRPLAIAWAPGDLVHVADEGGTVAVFDASGSFQRAYGAGTVRKAGALAVDTAGRAYVLDTEDRVVLVFGTDGALLHRIGGRGGEAGRLDDPRDVAVGPGGLVYVLDRGRRGVQVFSRDGTFVHDLLFPPELREPRALGVAASGRVYVADRELPAGLFSMPRIADALVAVGSPPEEIRTLPLRGAGLEEPVAVVVTPTGTVVVGDRESGVIWAADATEAAPVGSDDRVYGGRGSGRGSFRRLADVALVGSDEVVLLDRDGRKVERIRLVLEAERPLQDVEDYPVQLQTVVTSLDPGVLAASPSFRGTAWYALADADGRNVRVVEAELTEDRGVFGGPIRVPRPVAGRALHAFGQLVERAGHAAVNDTLLVVTEPRRNRFWVFDLRTDTPIGSFGDNYSDDRRLRDPRGVALFPDGRVAVADHGNDRIVVFSADVATLLGTFPFQKAEGVAIAVDGRMLGWDEDGLLAGEVPLEGGPVRSLPSSLTAGGVGALATDLVGNLYTLRRGSGRVAIADTAMQRVLARVGGDADLERGSRLTVDADGNIYATDLEHARTVTTRWGVDVAPVAGLSVRWGPGWVELRWPPVPGTFVSGYRVEGAEAEEGPWLAVADVAVPRARVDSVRHRWYRTAPRTLTGAVGRPSPPVPALHVAAGKSFAGGDWSGARALAEDALALVDAGRVEADAPVLASLQWQGFVAAHEEGQWEEALRWSARLGHVPSERAFDRAFRVAEAHQRLGNLADAMEEALLALQGSAGPTPDPDRASLLRRLVFDNGLALGRWVDATAAGEALLDRSADDPEFLTRLTHAHLRAGSPARAAELARRGLSATESEEARRGFAVLSFVAAADLGDLETALAWADSVGTSVPGEFFVDFQTTLARVRLGEGDLVRARSELVFLLLDEEEDVRALGDPRVTRTTLELFGAMVEQGQPDGARALLDTLVTALPGDMAEVRGEFLRQADSVYAIADTRGKLGEGFTFFRDALFRDALRFFQSADGRTDLDVDQRLIVKEILAAVYHSLGRLEDADAVYRGVYEVDPGFMLRKHLAQVEETYGLTIFTPEMVERFEALGPIM